MPVKSKDTLIKFQSVESCTGISQFFEPLSIEVVPKPEFDAKKLRATLPVGSRVFIPHLPGASDDILVDTTARIKQAGFHPIPHVAARFIIDDRHLSTHINTLADLGVTEILLVGGSCDKPRGKFNSCLDILESELFTRHPFHRLLFAGHPGGHPDVDRESIECALMDKIRYAISLGYKTGVMTQFCFDSKAILAWLCRIKERGLDVPIYIGLPGPATMNILLRYASICGVTTSIGMIKKRPHQMFNLIRESDPKDTAHELVKATRNNPKYYFSGFHIFPFGGIEKSVKWAGSMISDEQLINIPIRLRSDSESEIDNRSEYCSTAGKSQASKRKMQRLLKVVMNRPLQIRSLRIGFVVGLILNAINQGPEFITGTNFNSFKALLTFVVPYCVATYSAVSVSLNNASDKISKR